MVISTGSFPKALQGESKTKKKMSDSKGDAKAPPLFTYGKKKAKKGC